MKAVLGFTEEGICIVADQVMIENYGYTDIKDVEPFELPPGYNPLNKTKREVREAAEYFAETGKPLPVNRVIDDDGVEVLKPDVMVRPAEAMDNFDTFTSMLQDLQVGDPEGHVRKQAEIAHAHAQDDDGIPEADLHDEVPVVPVTKGTIADALGDATELSIAVYGGLAIIRSDVQRAVELIDGMPYRADAEMPVICGLLVDIDKMAKTLREIIE